MREIGSLSDILLTSLGSSLESCSFALTVAIFGKSRTFFRTDADKWMSMGDTFLA